MKTKRIFSSLLAMLLCLSLVIGVMPVIPAVSAAEVTHCGHEGHDGWNVLPASGTLVGNYYVNGPMTLTGQFEINGNVHIYLNGQKVSVGHTSNYVFNISSGMVDICDCAGGGSIDATGKAGRSIFNVRAGATLSIYGGTFTGRSASAKAGAVSAAGTFIMHGGSITGNTGTAENVPGAVVVEGGEFIMNGGSITGNTGYQGGAIYGSAGSVTINGGMITDNAVTADADKLSAEAIYMARATTLTINGGTISGNKLDSDTGLYSYPSTIHMYAATFVMTGGSVSCGEAVNTVILNKDTTCTYNISGSAQIDTGCLRYWQATANSSIGNLTPGANVNVKRTELTVASGDTTVVKTTTDVDGSGSWLYTYNTSAVGTRMELGNTLDMQFAIPEAFVANGETVTINGVPAVNAGTVEGYVQVEYTGIAAKQMSDTVTLKIDGVVYKEDSVRDYAARILTNGDPSDDAVVVDMLNYGAAAQETFGYNTDDLANKNLTPEQQALATTTYTAGSDAAVVGTNYLGSRLELENRIYFQMAFQNITSDMTAKYTVGGAEYTGELVDLGEGVFAVTLDQIVLKDVAEVVTCEIYDGETLVASATDSVANYIARLGADDDYSDICDAIMKFAASAKAYLG